MRAARVLELVDEHVVIARLELVAAARELFHLPQQLHGARQHFRKVQHGVRLECADVLRHGDVEEAPHAAGEDDVQIAPEPLHRIHDLGRNRLDRIAMVFPCRFGSAVVFLELSLTETRRLARLAILREEVRADAVDEHAEV